MREKMIVGLTGKKRSGKNTCATFLGFSEVAFADPIRRIGQIIAPEAYYAEMDKEQKIERLGRSRREIEQFIGTEFGRDFVNENVWVDILRRKLQVRAGLDICVTDVRFNNEARMLKEFGAVIVRVVRDSGVEDGHRSEAGISDEYVDIVVENNGSLEELRVQLLKKLGLPV